MNVRPARPEDASRIAEIHVRTWQDAYRGHMPDALLDAMTPAERIPMWSGMLAAPRARTVTLVADEEDRVMGFCSAGPARLVDTPDTDITGEMYAIYVLPECQGNGAGRLLMDTACEALLEAGFAYVLLWVLAGNASAIAFYECMGWEADGASKQEEIGGGVIEELRYWRSLP